MTSESTADRITNSLFQRISRDKAKDRVALRCPLCSDLLDSLLLEKDEKGCQTVWWMCKNTMKKNCTFPMDIPPNVFWVKRTPEQINDGYIPRPRLELLPPQYRHLYPELFPDSVQHSPLSSRPTSAFSRMDSNASFNSLHTRDMSLNSASVSVTTPPETTSCSDSVVVCDMAEQDGTITKSGPSLLHSTSKSSEGCGPINTVACVPTARVPSRKRVATEALPAPSKLCVTSAVALKRHVDKLKKEEQNDDIQALALPCQEDPVEHKPAKKRLRNYGAFDDLDNYIDSIAQTIPAVNKTEAHNVLATKSLTDRFAILQNMRNARSGEEILDAIGIKRKLPPQNNNWRDDMRQKVNETLNKAARSLSDHEKRLQLTHSAKRDRNVLALATVGVEAAPTTSADVAVTEEEDREAERKAKALIMGKVHAQMERRRQYLLQKVERIQRRNASRASVRTATPPVAHPVHDPYSAPLFEDFPSFPAVEHPSTSGEVNDDHLQDLFGHYDPLY